MMSKRVGQVGGVKLFGYNRLSSLLSASENRFPRCPLPPQCQFSAASDPAGSLLSPTSLRDALRRARLGNSMDDGSSRA